MTLILKNIDVSVSDGPETLHILNNANLQVGAGELTAITGASGSGKSTLIAVAGLLRRPNSGRVIIGGDDLTEANNRRRTLARQQHIGLIFQSANLLPSLTAVEQLELVAHIAGKLNSENRQRARALLGDVGLEGRLGHRPSQLSGGERQRVAIARALMGHPSVLLADEPTAALDEERGRGIMALLRELTQAQQTATVVVTHAPEQLTTVTTHLRLSGGALELAPTPT